MKRHIKYPKTEVSRTVYKSIAHDSRFVGVNEDGSLKYDRTIDLPTIKFIGTVKLHGTNASVSFNADSGLWWQSRKRIVEINNPDNPDNAGFARFCEYNKDHFQTLISKIVLENDIDTTTHSVTIYGEWAGQGVQGGVALSELPKKFFIFNIKVSPNSEPSDIESNKSAAFWLTHDNVSKYSDNDRDIYNIYDFKTFEIDIDLNNIAPSENKMCDLVNEVENECPVGKAFGVSGIGEGIVWVGYHKFQRYIFKTKGDKHSSSKVKKIKYVDEVMVMKVQDFIKATATENRFNQAVGEIVGLGDVQLEMQHIGKIIQWVVNDICIEERDIIVNSMLDEKYIKKQAANIVRKQFFEVFNNQNI